jgi:hypothetical protein
MRRRQQAQGRASWRVSDEMTRFRAFGCLTHQFPAQSVSILKCGISNMLLVRVVYFLWRQTYNLWSRWCIDEENDEFLVIIQLRNGYFAYFRSTKTRRMSVMSHDQKGLLPFGRRWMSSRVGFFFFFFGNPVRTHPSHHSALLFYFILIFFFFPAPDSGSVMKYSWAPLLLYI